MRNNMEVEEAVIKVSDVDEMVRRVRQLGIEEGMRLAAERVQASGTANGHTADVVKAISGERFGRLLDLEVKSQEDVDNTRAAMRAEPTENLHRLVHADALEEMGHIVEAAYHRHAATGSQEHWRAFLDTAGGHDDAHAEVMRQLGKGDDKARQMLRQFPGVHRGNAEEVNTFYHVDARKADGQPREARRNGKTQTWKRDTNRFRIPAKHGMYDYLDIDNDTGHQWTPVDPSEWHKPQGRRTTRATDTLSPEAPYVKADHDARSMVEQFESSPHLHTDNAARSGYADALEELGQSRKAAIHRVIAAPYDRDARLALRAHALPDYNERGSSVDHNHTVEAQEATTDAHRATMAATGDENHVVHEPVGNAVARSRWATRRSGESDHLKAAQLHDVVTDNHVDAAERHEAEEGNILEADAPDGYIDVDHAIRHRQAANAHRAAAERHREAMAHHLAFAEPAPPVEGAITEVRGTKSHHDMIRTFESTPALHTDPVARLAYADALEEAGKPHLAAFHRAVAQPEHGLAHTQAMLAGVGNDPDKGLEVSQEATKLSEAVSLTHHPFSGTAISHAHRAEQKASDREHSAALNRHHVASQQHEFIADDYTRLDQPGRPSRWRNTTVRSKQIALHKLAAEGHMNAGLVQGMLSQGPSAGEERKSLPDTPSPETPTDVKSFSHTDVANLRNLVASEPTNPMHRLVLADALDDNIGRDPGYAKEAAVHRVIAEPANGEYRAALWNHLVDAAKPKGGKAPSEQAHQYTVNAHNTSVTANHASTNALPYLGATPNYPASLALQNATQAVNASLRGNHYAAYGNHLNVAELHKSASNGHGDWPEQPVHATAKVRHDAAAEQHRIAAAHHVAMTEDHEWADQGYKAELESKPKTATTNADEKFGEFYQSGHGWVHPDGNVTPVKGTFQHAAGLHGSYPEMAEHHADLVKQGFGKGVADILVHEKAMDEGHVHVTSDDNRKTVYASGTKEALARHRGYLKDVSLGRRLVTLEHTPQTHEEKQDFLHRYGRARGDVDASHEPHPDHPDLVGTEAKAEREPHPIAREVASHVLDDTAPRFDGALDHPHAMYDSIHPKGGTAHLLNIRARTPGVGAGKIAALDFFHRVGSGNHFSSTDLTDDGRKLFDHFAGRGMIEQTHGPQGLDRRTGWRVTGNPHRELHEVAGQPYHEEANPSPEVKATDTTAKNRWVRKKVGKIMTDGIRGQKVDQKQAVAVAYSMWRKRQRTVKSVGPKEFHAAMHAEPAENLHHLAYADYLSDNGHDHAAEIIQRAAERGYPEGTGTVRHQYTKPDAPEDHSFQVRTGFTYGYNGRPDKTFLTLHQLSYHEPKHTVHQWQIPLDYRTDDGKAEGRLLAEGILSKGGLVGPETRADLGMPPATEVKASDPSLRKEDHAGYLNERTIHAAIDKEPGNVLHAHALHDHYLDNDMPHHARVVAEHMERWQNAGRPRNAGAYEHLGDPDVPEERDWHTAITSSPQFQVYTPVHKIVVTNEKGVTTRYGDHDFVDHPHRTVYLTKRIPGTDAEGNVRSVRHRIDGLKEGDAAELARGLHAEASRQKGPNGHKGILIDHNASDLIRHTRADGTFINPVILHGVSQHLYNPRRHPDQQHEEEAEDEELKAFPDPLQKLKSLYEETGSPMNGGECGHVACTLQHLDPSLKAYAVTSLGGPKRPDGTRDRGIAHMLVSHDGETFYDGRGIPLKAEHVTKVFNTKDEPTIVPARHVLAKDGRHYYDTDEAGVLDATVWPRLHKYLTGEAEFKAFPDPDPPSQPPPTTPEETEERHAGSRPQSPREYTGWVTPGGNHISLNDDRLGWEATHADALRKHTHLGPKADWEDGIKGGFSRVAGLGGPELHIETHKDNKAHVRNWINDTVRPEHFHTVHVTTFGHEDLMPHETRYEYNHERQGFRSTRTYGEPNVEFDPRGYGMKAEEESVRPSKKDLHPELENFRTEGGLFDVEPSELDLHVGKTGHFTEPSKNGTLGYVPFTVQTVQKLYDGTPAYRVVHHHGQGAGGFGSKLVRPNEVTVLEPSSEGISLAKFYDQHAHEYAELTPKPKKSFPEVYKGDRKSAVAASSKVTGTTGLARGAAHLAAAKLHEKALHTFKETTPETYPIGSTGEGSHEHAVHHEHAARMHRAAAAHLLGDLYTSPEAKSLSDDRPFVWFPTTGINTDEDIQYKESDGSGDGLNDERRQDSGTFDPFQVPPLALWQSDDGQTYVVDGHKRLGSARRNGCPVVRAYFVEAKSVEDAKRKGERINTKMGTKSFNHGDIAALRQVVVENPHEPMHRMVLADALDDNGFHQEAALHRVMAEPHNPEHRKSLIAAHGGNVSAAAHYATDATEPSENERVWYGDKSPTALNHETTGEYHSYDYHTTHDPRHLAAYAMHLEAVHSKNPRIAARSAGDNAFEQAEVESGVARNAAAGPPPAHVQLARRASDANSAFRGNTRRNPAESQRTDHLATAKLYRDAAAATPHEVTRVHHLLAAEFHERAAEHYGKNKGVKALPEPFPEAYGRLLDGPVEVKASDLDAHREHVEQHPHDTLARMTLADHLDDAGHHEEAAAHRLVGEPANKERLTEALAPHLNHKEVGRHGSLQAFRHSEYHTLGYYPERVPEDQTLAEGAAEQAANLAEEATFPEGNFFHNGAASADHHTAMDAHNRLARTDKVAGREHRQSARAHERMWKYHSQLAMRGRKA